MPFYTFELLDSDGFLTGLTTEEFYPLNEAPKIGETIEIEGMTWERRFCGSIGSAGIRRKVHGYPFRSESLPRGCCPESQDDKGRPIIKSQAHEREVLARTGYVREDPGWNSDTVRKYTEDMQRQGKL